ncbi:MAG: 6-carboxytetrahydropterin synthase [Cyanobacteria bacterium]|jgi:6-pyruvoyltetrahydropterin/6-carboxytetrahydropterin synthase|nr:6-carboxytetrahydropterin synthase [Cyanobacteriota bacterium]
MFEVMVEDHFSAAHHLLNYEGQCENQHGHNFVVRLWVQGEDLDQANLLIHNKKVKAALGALLEQLDHTDLNEFHGFAGESTSSEFVARYIYRNMKKVIPGVVRTCVYETPTAVAFYYE